MSKTSQAIKMFNVIRNNSTEAFVKTVPSATKENILSISNILFNDAYQPMLNEFVNNLINRIALTIVRNKSFSNPLAMFKKGSVPLGTDIQDIYENPAEPEQYELSNTAMAKLLTITDPDTHVAYYRRNRKDLYTKTILRENLQGAFVSWDKFTDFVNAITQSLYSGNYISEFKYTKDLIDGAYNNGKVITEVVANPSSSEANARAFVKACRKLYKKLTFPSKNYNAYSRFSGAKGEIETWTTEDRICLIVSSDAMADVDVDVLARAFNIESTKLLGRVIEVDHFDNPNIIGVMCDEAWLQIYDNLFRFDEFYNARVMAWNEYLHAWGTFAISPFANAVCLVTADSKPATALSMSTGNLVGQEVGDETEGTVTTTPADATTHISYRSDDENVATIEAGLTEKNYTITAKGLGNTTLYAVGDNGVSKSITISVTTQPATAITFGATSVSVAEGETKILELTSTPGDANDTVTFSAPEGYTTYFTIVKIDNKHVSITGVADTAEAIVLTATTSKSKTATINVSVTNA